MSESAFHTVHPSCYKLLPPSPTTVAGAGGDALRQIAKVQLRMQLPSVGVTSWPVTILQGLTQDLIIGADFLNAHQTVIRMHPHKTALTQNLAGTALPTPAPPSQVTFHATNLRSCHLLPRQTKQVTFSIASTHGNAKGLASLALIRLLDWEELGLVDLQQGQCTVPLYNRGIEETRYARQELRAVIEPISETSLENFDFSKLQPPRGTTSAISSIQPINQRALRERINNAVSRADISQQDKKTLSTLLWSHQKAIASNPDDLGWTQAVPHKLYPKIHQPIYQKQWPLPEAHKNFVNDEVDKLLRQKRISPSFTSPHNTPIFVVKKPHNGGL